MGVSLRIPSSFLLIPLGAAFLPDIPLAAAEFARPFEYKGLPGDMTIGQAMDFDAHSLTCETDAVVPAVMEHMEWTLADGELVLDEWIARFNPTDQRFATVPGLKFLPAALEKRRAEVAWANEKRRQADM